jgi:hypothetical protein
VSHAAPSPAPDVTLGGRRVPITRPRERRDG